MVVIIDVPEHHHGAEREEGKEPHERTVNIELCPSLTAVI